MLQRILACALICAATTAYAQDGAAPDGATEAPKVRKATDANFDAGTLIFVSTENASAMKSSMDASAFGRFMEEPSVAAYVDHLMKGVRTEMERSMPALPAPMDELSPSPTPDGETDGATDGDAKDGADMGGDSAKDDAAADWSPGMAFVDLVQTMWDDAQGRAAAAFGLRMHKGFQPNLIFHVEGGEKLGKAIDEFCANAMKNAARMDSIPVDSLMIAGFEFQGIEAKSSAPIGGMVSSPDGLYFGRRGNEFVAGISREGIAEYLQGSSPQSLANSSFYKSAVKHAPSTPESSQMFFNMKPIWDLLPMGAMFGGAEFQQMLTGLNASGLTELEGVYTSSAQKGEGGFSRIFVGRKSTKGLLGLVRSGNTTVPNFVPVDALTFLSGQVDYPKVAPLAEQMARALTPGLQDSQIAEFRGMVQQQIGATVEEALGALSGETVMITFPTNAAAILMNPEAATSLTLGMKVSDPEVIGKVFATIGETLPKSEMHGRTVLTISGGAPIRLCHDGDWMFASMSESDLDRVLAVRANPEAPNLTQTEVFEKNLKTASGSIAYTNTAESMAGSMDLLGVMFSGAMMVPGVGEMIVANPDLMFAVTPTNLPKAEVFRKHFGPSVGTLKVSDDGFLLDQEALPASMTPQAPSETKEKSEPMPKDAGEATEPTDQ